MLGCCLVFFTLTVVWLSVLGCSQAVSEMLLVVFDDSFGKIPNSKFWFGLYLILKASLKYILPTSE